MRVKPGELNAVVLVKNDLKAVVGRVVGIHRETQFALNHLGGDPLPKVHDIATTGIRDVINQYVAITQPIFVGVIARASDQFITAHAGLDQVVACTCGNDIVQTGSKN